MVGSSSFWASYTWVDLSAPAGDDLAPVTDRPGNRREGQPVQATAVHAFLSALAIALKTADRSRSLHEPRDLFLLVEAEIRQFFEVLPQHDNLTPKQMRELDQIREILRGLYHDADFVILDPKTEREQ